MSKIILIEDNVFWGSEDSIDKEAAGLRIYIHNDEKLKGKAGVYPVLYNSEKSIEMFSDICDFIDKNRRKYDRILIFGSDREGLWAASAICAYLLHHKQCSTVKQAIQTFKKSRRLIFPDVLIAKLTAFHNYNRD